MVEKFLTLLSGLDPERVTPAEVLDVWKEAGGPPVSLSQIKLKAGKALGLSEMQALTTSLQAWVRLARHRDEENPVDAAAEEEKKNKRKKSTASSAAIFKELKAFREESAFRHEELTILYEMLSDKLIKHIDKRFQQLWDAMLASARGEHVPERPFGRKSSKQE